MVSNKILNISTCGTPTLKQTVARSGFRLVWRRRNQLLAGYPSLNMVASLLQLLCFRSQKNAQISAYKAPAKRSQHANTTYRNIVGRNMLLAFGHRVATCCDVLGVVGSNLTSFKLEPTTANMSQHGSQTHATCCAQQCCDMLRWHVAIVWPGLKKTP